MQADLGMGSRWTHQKLGFGLLRLSVQRNRLARRPPAVSDTRPGASRDRWLGSSSYAPAWPCACLPRGVLAFQELPAVTLRAPLQLGGGGHGWQVALLFARTLDWVGTPRCLPFLFDLDSGFTPQKPQVLICLRALCVLQDVRIFSEDGTSRVVEIPADMTARDLCQLLVYRSHCVDDNSWTLVEHHPHLGLGREPAGGPGTWPSRRLCPHGVPAWTASCLFVVPISLHTSFS